MRHLSEPKGHDRPTANEMNCRGREQASQQLWSAETAPFKLVASMKWLRIKSEQLAQPAASPAHTFDADGLAESLEAKCTHTVRNSLNSPKGSAQQVASQVKLSCCRVPLSPPSLKQLPLARSAQFLGHRSMILPAS